MKVLESSQLDGISGGGGRNDSAAQRGTRNRNSSRCGRNNGDYYSRHTNPNCVNGVFTGMLGGLPGVAVGAFKGGCFDSGDKGGGNVGMGKGGNKGGVGNCAGKNGSGGCSW